MSTADEIKERINELPKGSISRKQVNGKTYFYHRWHEDGKLKEKYIPEEDIAELKKRIDERRKLESYLRGFHSSSNGANHEFSAAVRLGNALKAFAEPVRKYRKRGCFSILHEYIYGDYPDKVLILYGLRRTGKTTMIRQMILDMPPKDMKKTAFLQVLPSTTMAGLNKDLRYLEDNGYSFVFIDEATLLDDFIESAALFSDIFAASGMKIVLSGTDSLGFIFAEDDELYDRCIMLHTTYIPYREFSEVLGINGIDEYIRYGGTMSLSGTDYNKTSVFRNSRSTNEYIDTAIAHNIQHSLKGYQHGSHFRALQELYERDELTSAINRIVEDMNHRFTAEVLTRDFKSSDLAISRSNLRKDRHNPTDILDHIDIDEVTKRLMDILDIRNKEKQSIDITERHAKEIREYLELLDLVEYVDVLDTNGNISERTIITQPGLRYSQVESLVESLIQDKKMNDLSLTERTSILNRIRNEVKGRMMEDIVLLETKLAFPDKHVFVLHFPVGEFDMIVSDPESCTCSIYEIKHSEEINAKQYRHLIDKDKCDAAEHSFGRITGRYVIYRGNKTEIDGIEYLNVENYLKNITK